MYSYVVKNKKKLVLKANVSRFCYLISTTIQYKYICGFSEY